MSKTIIISITFILLCLCGFFILILLTWNKRSLRNQREFHALQKEAQRNLLEATITGQELERKRIAENLHDDIGPLLSALKLQIRNIEKDPTSINSMFDTLELAIQELRGVSQKLSPLVFEELGMDEAVKYVSQELIEKSGLSLTLDWNDLIEEFLEKNKQLAVFRIIQESLINIIKHSQASSVIITSSIKDDYFLISVEDDGVGMNMEVNNRLGIGLSSMKARAEYMNAKLIISSEGNGTCITLIIPQDINHAEN